LKIDRVDFFCEREYGPPQKGPYTGKNKIGNESTKDRDENGTTL